MTAPAMAIPELRMAELQARVDRGIAWLDVHLPDWWRTGRPSHGGPHEDGGPIDVDELNMAHNCYCVLGQLLGNYYRADISLDEAVACGFDTQIGSVRPDRPVEGDAWYAAMQDEFDALRRLWTTAIEQRRAGVDVPPVAVGSRP